MIEFDPSKAVSGGLDPGDRWVVCVEPDPKTLSQVDRAAVASILEVLPYEAGQLLAGLLPRVVAQGEQAAMLQRASSLLSAGLQAVAIAAATIFASDEVPVVRSLLLEDGNLIALQPHEAAPVSIGRIDMAIAVRLGEDSVTVTEKKQRKLSLGKTLATGMPLSKTVITKTVAHSVQETFGVYLFAQGRSEPAAWLDGNRADYAWLGDAKGIAPLPNFQATRRWLTTQFPEAFWDDRMFRPGKRPIPGRFVGWYRHCGTDLAIVRMIRVMESL